MGARSRPPRRRSRKACRRGLRRWLWIWLRGASRPGKAVASPRQICLAQAAQERDHVEAGADALDIDAHGDGTRYRDHGPIAGMREVEFDIGKRQQGGLAVILYHGSDKRRNRSSFTYLERISRSNDRARVQRMRSSSNLNRLARAISSSERWSGDGVVSETVQRSTGDLFIVEPYTLMLRGGRDGILQADCPRRPGRLAKRASQQARGQPIGPEFSLASSLITFRAGRSPALRRSGLRQSGRHLPQF